MLAKEELIFTIIVVVIVLVFLGILFLVMLARHNLKKNNLLHENERIRKEFEETLLNTQLEIQEQTLSDVSTEIHDNIGQVLSLVRLQINTFSTQPDEEDIVNTDELLGKAIADLRTLSHSLNTNNIREQGFIVSIRQLLTQLEKTRKFKTKLILDDNHFELNDEHGLILYRIVQEVMNNIVKHAEATEISVVIKQHNQKFQIEVTDNGRGFDTTTVNTKGKGIGLKNIISRANVIGAKLSLISQPGAGTTVRITI